MTRYNSNFERTFPFSDLTVQLALAANTALTYTVPGDNSNQYRCEFSFSYNANVWVGYNTTAVVPVPGSVTTVTNESLELNPGKFGEAKYVRGGDILSFISDSIVGNAGFSLLLLPSPK